MLCPPPSIHVQNQHDLWLDSQMGRPCPSLFSDSLIPSHQAMATAMFFLASEWSLIVSYYLQGVSSTKRILFVGPGARVFLGASFHCGTPVLPERRLVLHCWGALGGGSPPGLFPRAAFVLDQVHMFDKRV